GPIYFSQNIPDEAQRTETLPTTQGFKGPMFLAVDEEGGIVSRVAESGLAENVGSAAEIAASGDAQRARDAGTAIGGYLSKYGFNVDFAPVADVIEEGNAFIGERSFGSDTNQTASMAAAFVEGLQSNKVSACMKHFPGIGDTTEDMHDGKVISEKTIESFMEKDFPVYQAGIAAGTDFIMVSHLSVPNVTGDDTPASLSEKMITEILRGQLGYQGIVITDAMDMKAITDFYEPGEAAVRAILAGADMILMPDDFEAAYNGVLEAVNNGTLSQARIDESLQRIFRVKLRDRVQ
ncbi:MAG: glycoside hydrolase family 3 protein, partial [Lachnospiraceae bacterium]|nr:glycoside hydrolase family 3 protein [Lachnospiraceae bacterium]